MVRIGIDVGGTFTDAVAQDGRTGEVRAVKAPTTPDAPQEGILEALRRLETPLDLVDRIVHGLTLATNTVLERKGAEVWVVTNRGFRDTLEIARTNRPVLYNIKTLKAPSLVPRNRILEISARRLADGTVLRPIDSEELNAAIDVLRAGNARAVAVCLLHSYAYPMDEALIAELVQQALPEAFVTSSAEVLPEFREYERFTTAALNAYTGPRVGRYLALLDQAVGGRGYGKPVYIMTSNGGTVTAGRADARRSDRRMFVHGSWHEVPVYCREGLHAGFRFHGPAIIEEPSSVTVVPPGWRGSVDHAGVLFLDRERRQA